MADVDLTIDWETYSGLAREERTAFQKAHSNFLKGAKVDPLSKSAGAVFFGCELEPRHTYGREEDALSSEDLVKMATAIKKPFVIYEAHHVDMV